MAHSPLLALDAALAMLDRIAIPASAIEMVSCNDAMGRVLAEDIVALFDLPGFDNSAVDGFALRADDVNSGDGLQVSGSSFAGEPYGADLQPGMAVRIATGAKIPNGADTIAMQEMCIMRDGRLIVHEAPELGAHIRKAGQDVREGTIVLKAGSRLDGPQLAMIAALGIAKLSVRRRLIVAIASTGTELIEAGTRLPGQIYDSNRILLRSLLQPYNVDIMDLGIIEDCADATRMVLTDAAKRADLIITSGGVSVGTRDYVRDTIEQAGDILFWRLAIKPGKPLLCGHIGGTPIMGVPGNPVSTFVTFQLACRPLLRRLMGIAPRPPLRIPLRMGFTHRKSPALREFARVSLGYDELGLFVKPFRSQLSNLVSSLLESDGVVDLAAGFDEVKEGQMVDFLPWSGFSL